MQAPSTKIDWLSIGQLIMGVISCLITFSLAGLLVFLGISGVSANTSSLMDITALFMLAGLIAAVGILNIPSIILAARSLRGKQVESGIITSPFRLASFALISLPIWLLGGQWITRTTLAVWLLPWFNLLALLIPIWWLVEIGRRQLPSGSPQRSWGLASISLGITPIITIVVELIVTVLVILVVFMKLSVEPVWMDRFKQLIIQFNQSDIDPKFFAEFIKDLLVSPLVITAILLTVGLFMPLLEELLKPVGLWALRKRLLTPAEGFSGGLICGAGFALIESASMVAQTGGGADWGQMVLLRIGTSLLHITASGFVGWGLASAWSQKKYGRTILTILAAAGVHGLWNTMAILLVLLPLITGTGAQTILMQGFAGFGTITLISILILIATALILMNCHLRRETQTSNPEGVQPPSI
jgi:hypothetical protein